MAMLAESVPIASATLIDTLSGGFNQATPSGSDLDFSVGSAVNDPTAQIVGGTYVAPLTLNMTGSTSTVSGDVTTISGFSIGSLEISIPTDTTPDTITFNFENDPAGSPTITQTALSFGPSLTFYLGVIQATVGTSPGSVVIAGPDSASLTSELNDFIDQGGNLFLNYNGIDISTSGASLTAAPSESFTLVANVSSPLIPEPSSIILSLSGAAAIILGKLAQQLRRKNLVAVDESSES